LLTIERDLQSAGVRVARLQRRFPLDPLADLALARHVARLDPDIVHTWDTLPGLFGPVVNKKNGRPRIISGEYHLCTTKPALAWRLHRRFAAQIDRFVSNSPLVRDWNVLHGLPWEKFVVIPPGVPSSTDFSPNASRGRKSVLRRDELLQELSLPVDARLIGVVGALDHDHGVKRLIWAADLLRVLHDNLRMIVIGDGPVRDSLIRYARLASDLDHVRFLGMRDDIQHLMPHLDVLWNGGENTGPSVAILEAMSAGVPVVASDTPSNRELVVVNETGYLVPLHTRAGRADRARYTDRLFNDAALAQSLGERARARIRESFDAETYLRAHSIAYAELA
jgi:glycosyltransferase involved in cell wall biosynthesis